MKLRILFAILLYSAQASCADFEGPQCCKPCKPPTLNCPPKTPLSNPCDCLFDYYNPLVFTGWNASLDWLYWKVQQKASTFALTPHGNHQYPTDVADAIGRYQSAKFDWNSGVRLGLDYTFVRDAWNFLGQYTYYGTGGTANVFRPSEPTLYLEATNRGVDLPSPSDGIDHMTSKSFFRYQVIDLLLSRRYLAGGQVLLNFFSGATGAFIHEKWDVLGYYVVGAVPNVTTKTQNRWRFNGGGIRMGVNADWHLGYGVGLFQKLSFAGLVGQHSNKRKTNTDPINLTDTFSRLTEFNPIRHTVQYETWAVPNTQLAFGATWNHRFSSVSMNLIGAFEVNTWYDLHQFHQDGQFLTAPTEGKLDIENSSPVNLWGFNLGLDFSF